MSWMDGANAIQSKNHNLFFGATGADQYWGNDVCLLDASQGNNGDTSAIDYSTFHTTPLFAGSAKLSNTRVKFGNASFFASNIPGILTVTYDASKRLDGFDFTIEVWLNPVITKGAIIKIGENAGPRYFCWLGYGLAGNNGKYSAWLNFDGAAWQVQIDEAGTSVVNGQWHHFVLMRNGATVYMLVDAVLLGQANVGASNLDPAYTIMPQFGLFNTDASQNYFADQFRVTRSIARYNPAGGYALPSAPFPHQF